jgi:hypothetical protein
MGMGYQCIGRMYTLSRVVKFVLSIPHVYIPYLVRADFIHQNRNLILVMVRGYLRDLNFWNCFLSPGKLVFLDPCPLEKLQKSEMKTNKGPYSR